MPCMPPSLTEAVASSTVSLLRTVSYILLFRVESSTPCRRKSRYFFCRLEIQHCPSEQLFLRGHKAFWAFVWTCYLCNPDKNLKLVDMQLLIHTLSEPGPQKVHGGSVPLLKHINTTLSSKTHTRTHTQHTTSQHKTNPKDKHKEQRLNTDHIVKFQAPPCVFLSITSIKMSWQVYT